MESKFEKPYNPKEVEDRIYTTWEESGYFNPDNLPPFAKATEGRPGTRESYTIMIAPPNITGSLHMGHALQNTISDILIRYHRMRGYRALWVPGTDHAGIATQNVVEKELKKQGLTRHDLGREAFLKKIWEWREQYGDIILGQLKKLGCSLDWSRTRFTMDADYQEAVREAFLHYQKKGLIYQGERVINWCIKDQTALSDLELEYIEERGKLWHIRYPLKNGGFIEVATTRPETMLGDMAVAVHPDDPRYKDVVGQFVVLPLVNREIPIVADESIDAAFGTGAVKVTPAHDMADSAIAERHNLPFMKVINEVGKIVNVGSDFDGLSLSKAREKVLIDLTEAGLLIKDEVFSHNVAKCYRCASTIEPMLSKQWFLKMKPLAELAIAAIQKGDIHYTPDRWKDIVLDWLHDTKDWCISRQIWWGHPLPIEGSSDVFDTWFSSALWPFAALGWPSYAKATEGKPSDLERFYPTTVIASARDIIHLWVSRMIFSGLEFTGTAPFSRVHIHGTVLTKDGKRMSKSLGTGIDPLLLIEKYGADATRFGLMWQNMGGQDIHFSEEHVMAGKKFANKLWNISRFVLQRIENSKYEILNPKQDLNDIKDEPTQVILAKLAETKRAVEEYLERYEFGQALHTLYDFIWHDVADVYIEYSKTSEREETSAVLAHVLFAILKMVHPFMPFVTEEIYQSLPHKDAPYLMVAEW